MRGEAMMDDWMERLRAGIDAGYYRIEDGTDEQVPLPKPRRWQIDEPHEIDVTDIIRGWLRSPDGASQRFIAGLGSIAEDLHVTSVRPYWAPTVPGDDERPVTIDAEAKRIDIDPRLYDAPSHTVRFMIGAALGCLLRDTMDWDKGAEWAEYRYGEMTQGEENIRLRISDACYQLLSDIAKVYGWGIEDAAHIALLTALRQKAQDQRTLSGKMGFDATPTYEECSRITHRYHRRRGWA